MFTDVATHWVTTGVDAFGKQQFATPVTIKCRWESKIERLTTMQGEDFVSGAMVFHDDVINNGDYLFHGESVVDDPLAVDDAWRVQISSIIASIDNVRCERKSWLLSARQRR